MTKQSDFKRRVRARMAKTGESYAAARGRLLAGRPGTAPDGSPLGWMPEALHISNGDATDVPGTGLARRVIYWRDVLHEGPVPEAAPPELRRIRAGYLAGQAGAGRAAVMRQFTERDQALDAHGRHHVLRPDGPDGRRAAPAAPPRPAGPPGAADNGRAPDRHRGAGAGGRG
jgi:hypothetical protein